MGVPLPRRLLTISMLCVICAACSKPAPTKAQAAATRPSPQTLYDAFAEAYGRFDVQAVTALYADGAVLVTEGAPVSRGREAISETYRQNFDDLRAAGATRVDSTYRIVRRVRSGSLVADFGYGRFVTTTEGGGTGDVSYGRFQTTLAYDQQLSQWRYVNDFVTGADDEARTLFGDAEPVAPSLTPTALPEGEAFAIDGNLTSSSCDDIYLAAKTLVLNAHEGTAFADVVNRTYTLQQSGGRLTIDGSFDDEAGCGEADVVERWQLKRTGDELHGTLTSKWRTLPGCDSTCTAVFDIHGALQQR